MKKKIMLTGIALAATTLMTVAPLTNEPISQAIETPVQANTSYNDSEYALMGYLKLADASAAELSKNKPAKEGVGLTLKQKGNMYIINCGGHSTYMIVNADTVTVKYDDFKGDGTGMGDKNASKTYSKTKLAAEYGKDKPYLDKLIKTFNLTDGSGSSTYTVDGVEHAKLSKTTVLDYNSITPMETAAAITYYRQPRMFQDATKQGGMELRQRPAGDVDHPGNGLMFSLIPKNAQSGDFSYTVDHNGQVYFYGAGDHHWGSANLHKIINKINNEGAVNKVRALANETDLMQ